MSDSDKRKRATAIVGKYTVIAAGTGAAPVPAASAAVVAETAAMFAEIAAVYGTKITWFKIAASLGAVGGLNAIGRALFVELAKVLSWGTGSPWAAVALSGIGATTAGVQTYILGTLAIAICENGGDAIPRAVALDLVSHAKSQYASFVAEWKAKSGKGVAD